jgi:iron(III) transport system substrate-binding protein
MLMSLRRLLTAVPAALLVLSACSTPGSAAEDPDALVVYNAQHESLTKLWADGFTRETGVKVVLRNGRDFELANQIRAEGAASPADVFLTENSPAMSLVEQGGQFAGVNADTLAQVPKRYSTSTGKWVGIAARSTVFVYNTERVSAEKLPASIMDLADPSWQGRWGASPGGADYQAIVSAMLELEGEKATGEWLAGMKANYRTYQGNNAVLQAVNNGEIDGGIIYHYYWYRDQAKTKEISGNTRLHFFGNQDPGAFVSVSGGGVLAGAKHPEQAQQFLKFVTGPVGQQVLAESAEFEYSVGSKVPSNPALKPLDELEAPVVDPSRLNGPKVIELMTQAGII